MENQVDATAAAAKAVTNVSISANQVALPPLSHMSYAKPFLDISKIGVFNGNNFKQRQERVHSILDVHGVAFALTEAKSIDDKLQDQWIHANKVCRHTIISTLSNELFDVYCPYKEAKQIWDSMTAKYTAEDVGRQKFVIGNYYRWEMSNEKEIKTQINEYHKLVEDLKAENINLQEEFIAGLLIEKLCQKAKEIATRANLTLAPNDVLHVPNIRANLVSVALLGKVRVKVSFESDKIVMTKNNVFVGKGYCN
ncbi:hypothetical protein BT93_H3152 [Corymbia citriodora subsp. variegata]|nr:hypothetical protein BT93_H3152 [Corymbia citriodora subsp. variegata]